MAFGNKIGIDAVPTRLFRKEQNAVEIRDSDLPLGEQIKVYEREIISRMLIRYGNSSNAKEQVARELGLSRATLYRKLVELDL
jgi:transcriptional regulator with PAS, ATPase and Fis domain